MVWFLHPELNLKCRFADRRLKLAFEISERGSILFNNLTLISLNVMAGLELFKKNVGIMPYQPAFHISPTCSLSYVHIHIKVKRDPEHYIKNIF